MKDLYGREVTYMRVSVTDRCNMRCKYCMPASGVRFKNLDDVLSWDEFYRVIRLAVDLGVRRVRLTGGEPTTRPGLVEFAARLAALPGVDDLALSTNAMLLERMAQPLKDAGIRRLNVSLDSLRPDRFREITRFGDWQTVWAGIERALEVGFDPIKLNCVVSRGVNDDELIDFVALTEKLPLHIRFVELMPLGTSHRWAADRLVPAAEMRERILERYALAPATVEGGGPAKYHRVPGFRGTVGFITAMTENFCSGCNRVRLTADGELQPCLGSLLAIDLKGPLRNGTDDAAMRNMIAHCIRSKPEKHLMDQYLEETAGRKMWAIGG